MIKGIGWELRSREFKVGDKVVIKPDISCEGYQIAGKQGVVIDNKSYVLVEVELGRDKDYSPVTKRFNMLRYEIEHADGNANGNSKESLERK
jgi:hypothetical protein